MPARWRFLGQVSFSSIWGGLVPRPSYQGVLAVWETGFLLFVPWKNRGLYCWELEPDTIKFKAWASDLQAS